MDNSSDAQRTTVNVRNKDQVIYKTKLKAVQSNPCSKGCINKCSEKFTEMDRIAIFNHYWGLAFPNVRRQFIYECVQKKSVLKRYSDAQHQRQRMQYTLPVNGERKVCCQIFLLKTLDVTQKLLRYSTFQRFANATFGEPSKDTESIDEDYKDHAIYEAEDVKRRNDKSKGNTEGEDIVDAVIDSGKQKPSKKNIGSNAECNNMVNLDASRRVQPSPCLNGCINNCAKYFTEEDRFQMFQYFWDLPDHETQRNFLLSCMDDVKTKKRYSKIKDKQRQRKQYYLFQRTVCQIFLLKTLDISQNLLRYTNKRFLIQQRSSQYLGNFKEAKVPWYKKRRVSIESLRGGEKGGVLQGEVELDTTGSAEKSSTSKEPLRKIIHNLNDCTQKIKIESEDLIKQEVEEVKGETSSSLVDYYIDSQNTRSRNRINAIETKTDKVDLIPPDKTVRPNPCFNKKCINKCEKKFTEDERWEVFRHFWNLGNNSKRREFISNCITDISGTERYARLKNRQRRRRQFSLLVGNERRVVCQIFIMKTLDISQKLFIWKKDPIPQINKTKFIADDFVGQKTKVKSTTINERESGIKIEIKVEEDSLDIKSAKIGRFNPKDIENSLTLHQNNQLMEGMRMMNHEETNIKEEPEDSKLMDEDIPYLTGAILSEELRIKIEEEETIEENL